MNITVLADIQYFRVVRGLLENRTLKRKWQEVELYIRFLPLAMIVLLLEKVLS